MNDSDKPLKQKAREWLEKTGLPLEMRAARAFQSVGFEVTQGHPYVDVNEKKSREIDVLARYHDPLGLLQFLIAIECKSSDKPWVVLKQADPNVWNRHLAFGMYSETIGNDIRSLLHEDEHTRRFTYTSDDAGYGFREIFADKNKDRAYEASMSAANACAGLLASPGFAKPRRVFVLPLVIVDSPLFEARLEDDGSLNVAEIKGSHFVFSGLSDKQCLIRVLTATDLASRAKFFMELAKRIQASIQPDLDKWVQQQQQQAARRQAKEARDSQRGNQ